MLWLYLFCVYTITLVNSAVTTSPSPNNPTPSLKVEHNRELLLPIEGGTLVTSTLDLSHSKKKQLDVELVKDTGKLTTSVKSRKRGDISAVNSEKPSSATSDETSRTVTPKPNTFKNDVLESHTTNITTSKVKSNINITITKLPKKPLILSDEGLRNSDKNIKHDEYKLPTTKPSSDVIPNQTKTQIPSPNADTILKLYPAKADSHPSLLMPIVITILVVPMFAIVGYMALRTGQEAWKNRHYKRMDFLLDGMYND